MVRTLNGPAFSRVLRAGALAVVREQESLNRINVFPVRDADTWFKQRRPELLRLYEAEIYGRVPAHAHQPRAGGRKAQFQPRAYGLCP